MHAYDINYHPGNGNAGHLPRGVWAVKLKGYPSGTGDKVCGIRVNVQSGTQVFRSFTSDLADDFGKGAMKYQNGKL